MISYNNLTANYFEVLGLKPGCSLADIKQAYRTRAKQFHPDLNKAPDAQERFIQVNEAYEYFIKHFHTPRQERIVSDGTTPAEMEEIMRQWMERERARARARAARYARAKYESFRNSPLYRTSSMLSMAADYFTLVVGGMTMLGPMYGMYYLYTVRNELTWGGIFAAILTFLLGFMIIAFSVSDIRRRRKELKKMKEETVG